MAADGTYRTEEESIRVETVADGLEHPWGLDFLPDGRMLVTERPGRLRHRVPRRQAVRADRGRAAGRCRGQGGLLDVALDPEFRPTGWSM